MSESEMKSSRKRKMGKTSGVRKAKVLHSASESRKTKTRGLPFKTETADATYFHDKRYFLRKVKEEPVDEDTMKITLNEGDVVWLDQVQLHPRPGPIAKIIDPNYEPDKDVRRQKKIERWLKQKDEVGNKEDHEELQDMEANQEIAKMGNQVGSGEDTLASSAYELGEEIRKNKKEEEEEKKITRRCPFDIKKIHLLFVKNGVLEVVERTESAVKGVTNDERKEEEKKDWMHYGIKDEEEMDGDREEALEMEVVTDWMDKEMMKEEEERMKIEEMKNRQVVVDNSSASNADSDEEEDEIIDVVTVDEEMEGRGDENNERNGEDFVMDGDVEEIHEIIEDNGEYHN